MNNEQKIIELLNINGQLLRVIAGKLGITAETIEAHLERSLEIRYPLPEETK